MLKNFRLGQSNELIMAGHVYDLHNCFDFEKISFLRDCELDIIFKPNSIYGQGNPEITIRITDVDYFECSPRFFMDQIYDLEEIGYKARDDRDDSWLLSEDQAPEAADLFLRFSGGHFIRVHGTQALVLLS
jgi:hypothetical protein